MGVGEPPPVFRLQGNDCFGLFLLTCRLPQVISRMLELSRTPTSCGPYCWSVRAAGEMMRVKRTIKVLALPFTSCQYWGRSPHLSNPDAPSAAQRTGRLISLTLMHLARPKGRYRPIGGFKITVLDCSCGRKNVLQQTKKDFFLYPKLSGDSDRGFRLLRDSPGTAVPEKTQRRERAGRPWISPLCSLTEPSFIWLHVRLLSFYDLCLRLNTFLF